MDRNTSISGPTNGTCFSVPLSTLWRTRLNLISAAGSVTAFLLLMASAGTGQANSIDTLFRNVYLAAESVSTAGYGDALQASFFSPERSEPLVRGLSPPIIVPTAGSVFGPQKLDDGPTGRAAALRLKVSFFAAFPDETIGPPFH